MKQNHARFADIIILSFLILVIPTGCARKTAEKSPEVSPIPDTTGTSLVIKYNLEGSFMKYSAIMTSYFDIRNHRRRDETIGISTFMKRQDIHKIDLYTPVMRCEIDMIKSTHNCRIMVRDTNDWLALPGHFYTRSMIESSVPSRFIHKGIDTLLGKKCDVFESIPKKPDDEDKTDCYWFWKTYMLKYRKWFAVRAETYTATEIQKNVALDSAMFIFEGFSGE